MENKCYVNTQTFPESLKIKVLAICQPEMSCHLCTGLARLNKGRQFIFGHAVCVAIFESRVKPTKAHRFLRRRPKLLKITPRRVPTSFWKVRN